MTLKGTLILVSYLQTLSHGGGGVLDLIWLGVCDPKVVTMQIPNFQEKCYYSTSKHTCYNQLSTPPQGLYYRKHLY